MQGRLRRCGPHKIIIIIAVLCKTCSGFFCVYLNSWRVCNFSGAPIGLRQILYTFFFVYGSFYLGPLFRVGMLVGFTTTCAISFYHHQSCDFESCSWAGVHVLNTTLCDKVCQCFSPFSSSNKTDHHDIAEISLTLAP